MAQSNSQLTDAVSNLAEAALIDLPLLAIGRVFTSKVNNDLYQAGWKAYDAAVVVTTEITNRLYSSPTVGRVAGRAVDLSLRTQRLADAFTGAFFSALWPMMGLPTATDIQRLSHEIDSLREEIKVASVGKAASATARFDEALLHTGGMYEMLPFPLLPTAPAGKVKRNVGH